MREALEEKLVKEFPFLEENSEQGEDRIDNLYLAFGCECDDGWYELLREMFKEIVDRYKLAGLAVDLEVLQIKEKFAELRVYYSFKQGDSTVNQAVSYKHLTLTKISCRCRSTWARHK